MDQLKPLKDILREALESKNLTIEKLSEATEISAKHLKAFIEGNYVDLPAAPYVRGYLVKISNALELDGQSLWQTYRKQLLPRSSGELDKLPQNRFAFKKAAKGKFIIAGIVIVILAIGGFKLSQFTGMPSIEITNPSLDETIVNTADIEIRGKINPQDKLSIRGEDVAIDKNGYFQKDLPLDQGINTIEFKVKRLLGKEYTVTKQVIYQVK